MAATVTTLAAAISADIQSIRVTSATGAVVGDVVKVDNEYMEVLDINGTTITVARRGEVGGAVVAHGVLAPVVFGEWSDFPTPGQTDQLPEPDDSNFLNIGADGIITVPNRNTTYVITKGSALASTTLADPPAGATGLELTFIGLTDFAHVITTVNAHDGTTGAHTTLTSAAFAGSTLVLVAVNAKWYVKSNNLWVIS